jgi:hypothetical protein
MKRSHVQIALYMLAVFVSGIAVGVLGQRLYTVNAAAKMEPRRLTKQEFRQKYMSEMRERLRLTDEQATRLSGILDRTDTRFDAFREQHRPEISAIHQEQIGEINAMLNESQRAEYEEYRAEREKKRREAAERKR